MKQFECSVELIYARDVDGLIGINDKIPWKLSADLKRFKEITSGHIVMMGRKTYDSIGHPLVNRVNVVITSKNDLVETEELITCKDPVDFIKRYKDQKYSIKKLFIIGGQDLIANVGFKHADVIHVTQLYKNFQHQVVNWDEGVYVPLVPQDTFKMESQTPIYTGEDLLTYNFITYRRR